nr:hypothetical protein [Tanacetum cinerariifolium]
MKVRSVLDKALNQFSSVSTEASAEIITASSTKLVFLTMDKYPTYFLAAIFLALAEKVLLAAIKLINLKSKKVGEDTNCSHFIIQFEFYGINRVVSILPLSGSFSCERDGGGFHYFSKLYGLFMAKAKEILIALSLATKVGCYHDLLPDDYNARFLSY